MVKVSREVDFYVVSLLPDPIHDEAALLLSVGGYG